MRAGALARTAWLGFALLLAAVAVACRGKAADDAYGEASAVGVESDEVTVEMRDIQFHPQGIRVQPGTSVVWVNEDPVNHNVRQVQSAVLSPDVMRPGDSFSFTLEEPGTYRYQCTFHHPNMNGVVIVEGGRSDAGTLRTEKTRANAEDVSEHPCTGSSRGRRSGNLLAGPRTVRSRAAPAGPRGLPALDAADDAHDGRDGQDV